MHAQSLVVTTRILEDTVGDVLAQPRLAGNGTVRDRGLAALETLGTIDALVAAGAPLPVPETPSESHVDDTVTALLDRLYEQKSLDRGAVDEARLDAVRPTGRVQSVGETLVVPLTTESRGAHNWRPVYRLLFDSLERIADQCARICARFESELSESSVTRRIWESCVTMLRETRTAVRIQLSRQERLGRLYGRSGTDSAAFAEWTLEQLTDIQTES